MAAAAKRLVDRYLESLAVQRRMSPHTCDAYRRDLNRLYDYCDSVGIVNWKKVDVHTARSFAVQLHRQGLSPRSIQRTLSAARGLYQYLTKERLAKINPFTGASAPKSDKRLPKALNVDQMTLLLAVKENHPLAIRDRAMMELLYSSGIRLAELVGLDLDRLDLTHGAARVTGKGKKTRDVPIGRIAVDALDEWLIQRALIEKSNDPAVFLSNRGRRISERAVQQRIAYWARKQGVGESVHPHMLRHSFATHMLESSGELRAVQELLGHANISTTQVYTHLDFQHLAKVYDSAHPRAKKPLSGA